MEILIIVPFLSYVISLSTTSWWKKRFIISSKNCTQPCKRRRKLRKLNLGFRISRKMTILPLKSNRMRNKMYQSNRLIQALSLKVTISTFMITMVQNLPHHLASRLKCLALTLILSPIHLHLNKTIIHLKDQRLYAIRSKKVTNL